MNKKRYLVMALESFENLQVTSCGERLTLRMDGNFPCGYLPVFETREKAEEFSGGKYDVKELETGPFPIRE